MIYDRMMTAFADHSPLLSSACLDSIVKEKKMILSR
jgi:hypothetical protein